MVVKDVKKEDLDLESDARFFQAENFEFVDEDPIETSAPEPKQLDIVSQLKELALLKEQGALTEDEFVLLKKKIIES